MQQVIQKALVGSLVDQYHIERELGKGGGGGVYLATDVKLDRKVAIKFAQFPPGMDHTKAQERFYREIRSLVKLNHPNIVQLCDFNMNAYEGPYYVMEYLQGKDLEACLQQRGAFSVMEIYAISQQLCSALQASHKQGIVFRDLKTPNIFIVPAATYQHVKLVDFGVALSADDERMTQKGHIIGTPYFMAPEQIMNTAAIGPQADIYAFGIVLYRMLTNDYPFPGINPFEVLRQHCQDEPRLDHPAINPEMKMLFRELLAKKPEQRPDSMLEVWNKLELILASDMRRRGNAASQPFIAAFHELGEQQDTLEQPSKPDNASAPNVADYQTPQEQLSAVSTPAPLSNSKDNLKAGRASQAAPKKHPEPPGDSLLLEFDTPDWWEKSS